MTPEQLLFSYYERSFLRNLGIRFPSTPHRFCSLNEYIQNELPKNLAQAVQTRLQHYQSNIAPFVKTRSLLDFLDRHRNLQPDCLLDFGCGTGHIIKHLSIHLESLRTIWGVDPVVSILPTREVSQQEFPRIFWHRSLDKVDIPDHTLSLIITIHTLHHLEKDEQVKTLDRLIALLELGDILYVCEDSWTLSNQSSLSTSVDLDLRFSEFSTEQKLQAFELNEYWSNSWCYGRVLDTNKSRYRPLEEWFTLLTSKDLEVVVSGAIGFDVSRLHGVPSVWLLARKSG